MTEKNGPSITVTARSRSGAGIEISGISVSSCLSGMRGKPDAASSRLS